MKRKTAVLLATIGFLVTIIGVLSAQIWYFSREVKTISQELAITINDPGEFTTRYQNISFYGTVTLDGVAQNDIPVTLWLNDTEPVATTFTYGSGNWALEYNNTYPAGTLLRFKAGVLQ